MHDHENENRANDADRGPSLHAIRNAIWNNHMQRIIPNPSGQFE